MSDWQPIESAPKDDTMIVAWCQRGPLVISGRMLAIAELPETPLHLRLHATHWMPLPQPPTESEKA